MGITKLKIIFKSLERISPLNYVEFLFDKKPTENYSDISTLWNKYSRLSKVRNEAVTERPI